MLTAASSRTGDVERLKLGLTAAQDGAGDLAEGTDPQRERLNSWPPG